MAFDLSVIRGTATYSLSAGTPFKLTSAQGLAYPSVQRVTMRAPTQDGDVNYGYYLDPRVITLALSFAASSGSALDVYRNTLFGIFRPDRTSAFGNPTGDTRFQANTPLVLQVTRDDGEVRRIGCYVTGEMDVPIAAEYAPGHLHRAAVQLIAPNPTWYGTAVVSESYTHVSSGTPFVGTIAYDGGYFAQPTFTINGPGTAWVITNTTTGAALNFGSSTLASADDVLTVDTLSNYVESAGVTIFPTGSLDIDALNIAPAPVAAGGTNVFQVTATSSAAGAAMTIQYPKRYVSY